MPFQDDTERNFEPEETRPDREERPEREEKSDPEERPDREERRPKLPQKDFDLED